MVNLICLVFNFKNETISFLIKISKIESFILIVIQVMFETIKSKGHETLNDNKIKL